MQHHNHAAHDTLPPTERSPACRPGSGTRARVQPTEQEIAQQIAETYELGERHGALAAVLRMCRDTARRGIAPHVLDLMPSLDRVIKAASEEEARLYAAAHALEELMPEA